MKTYAKNSNVRKPMMYGGMSGARMSAPMGAGMMADKKKKNMMGMMYGSTVKKPKKMMK
tara:strand:+ start:243 stop:419 length:177 start_codon:yes stop_codon:yes gene_type:complete